MIDYPATRTLRQSERPWETEELFEGFHVMAVSDHTIELQHMEKVEYSIGAKGDEWIDIKTETIKLDKFTSVKSYPFELDPRTKERVTSWLVDGFTSDIRKQLKEESPGQVLFLADSARVRQETILHIDWTPWLRFVYRQVWLGVESWWRRKVYGIICRLWRPMNLDTLPGKIEERLMCSIWLGTTQLREEEE